ncbi:MAG: Mfa1 family fimbria major subunit [Bacteroidales bacterium]|nr:Mfa1 family fimbria major subunit [Bacteroidales bacterium]
MKKQFFLAAFMLLGAGVVATSCSNEDVSVINDRNQGTTHMSLLIGLPQANGALRAPAQDGQDKPQPDYNHVGEWKGKDLIEKIVVYVFAGEGTKAFEKAVSFEAGQFQVIQPSTGNQAFIKPLKGIKTTAGKKQVYVVVNPTAAVETLLPLSGAGLTDVTTFETKLHSDELAFAGTGVATKTTNPVKTNADEIAEIKSGKDKILMTGESSLVVDVLPGITEHTTINTTKNRAAVTVQRAVARVLVSTKDVEYTIYGDSPQTLAVEDHEELGTLTDLRFVVGQGERKLFFTQQKSATPDVWAFKTPASEFVPAGDTYNTAGGTDAVKATQHYDYAGLWKEYKAPETGISGMTITQRNWHANAGTDIPNGLDAAVSGEFLLPNTHAYAAAPAEGVDYTGGYRKGNTAYVLVRGKFTPKYVTAADGGVSVATPASFNGYAEGKLNDADPQTAYDAAPKGTFVLGSNGHYYANLKDAQTHVPGMECSVYVGGKVLYFAWINPDQATAGAAATAPRWFNSPVIRNNIYHIQIKGVSKIGLNWNPLVPGDPQSPNNPDPKPKNPKEPKKPGTDPNDPLTPKDTWMSVEATILPWQVHSYEIDLQ